MDPAGVFSTSFTKDQALIRTRPQAVCLALFIVALFALPMFSDIRIVAVLTSMMITAVVVVGLQINTGLAGQVNLGQAAFMGAGAYSTAVLASKLGLPFWIALPMGGMCAAVFGLIFGLAAVRIKGFYLALTTIAAQILFHFLVLNLPNSWLGGSNGLALEPASLFGFTFDSDISLYYLCLVVALIMIAGAYGVARSRHGRIFAAVRDDDVASGMMGIHVVRTKALAFLLGAFYAGIGGGLWAYYVRFVAIDQFTLIHSIWFIAMIIVGGMGSVTGALIGVFVIRLMQEIITSIGPSLVQNVSFLTGDVVFAAMSIFLGGVIAGFLIFEPRGLMHRWNIIKRSYRIWPYPY
ncbi:MULTISPECIES: branched-chain amino acid ABC transporter permease [Alcaligenes]|uniref:Branched-chain amino acid ABC transporter permease n=1 Tax=Alcaligenes phenolicus TaxID=232846 RepID=A0AAW5W5A1_9BURK|nr:MULTISPECIES: branched-chain amino acid ABC transporter permease [Alcaligenes]MCX5567547.1 branched-chain amino acid ABC transporter permease [Alcaligenes phenolicus]QXR35328.1 branched-chain amino acid ABC transporter permease [Alcaligenes aquatilis]